MANIIQGWKGLHGKSAGLLLTAVNYDRKKFYDIGPRCKSYKKILSLTLMTNMQHFSFLESFSALCNILVRSEA
jgi:hypothetical protein